MPEITITLVIHVPEGSTVAVAPAVRVGAPATSGGTGPLPQALAAAPPHIAGDQCPVHRLPWKFVPGGYSKTKLDEHGQPLAYVAFYSCPERGCKQRPPQGWRSPNSAPSEGNAEWEELGRLAG